MKFATKSIAFVLLGLTAAVGTASATPIDLTQYQDKKHILVACVGDSITAGIGADKGMSYPNQLQALLGPKWYVQNFGSSGRTLLKKGDRPYWNEKAFAKVHNCKPDVVIIMLGTNDSKPHNWTFHDEFKADYKELVESFKSLPNSPRVFVCHPCPVFAGGRSGASEANVELEIPLIDQVAAEEKVDVIDIHGALAGKPQLSADTVHPNTAGAAVLAQTVATALTGPAATKP